MQRDRLKKELLTIPNLLSMFRLLLIPVYVLIYLRADSAMDYFVAATILTVSCLTDMIDGKIARKYNMISNFGKILDPLADKTTQFSMIICLYVKYPVLIAVILLFILKEGFQLIAGTVSLKRGFMLKGALMSGKISTTVLFITLILLVLIPEIPYICVIVMTLIDITFMSIAFIDYCQTYRRHKDKFQQINMEN